MISVEIDIPAGLKGALAADLDAALELAGVGIASAIQNVVAPYPPTRPGQKYIRGYGMPGGRKTSQMLGRRWGIQRESRGARLFNTASYAPYVHGSEDQARVHQGRWTTDKQGVEAVKDDGTVERIVKQALTKALE